MKTLFCKKVYHGEEADKKRKLSNQTGLKTTLFLMGAPPHRALLTGVRPIYMTSIWVRALLVCPPVTRQQSLSFFTSQLHQAPGNQEPGNQASGNQSQGNQSLGNFSLGNQVPGNQARGKKFHQANPFR